MSSTFPIDQLLEWCRLGASALRAHHGEEAFAIEGFETEVLAGACMAIPGVRLRSLLVSIADASIQARVLGAGQVDAEEYALDYDGTLFDLSGVLTERQWVRRAKAEFASFLAAHVPELAEVELVAAFDQTPTAFTPGTHDAALVATVIQERMRIHQEACRLEQDTAPVDQGVHPASDQIRRL